jgi:hypothetical protein
VFRTIRPGLILTPGMPIRASDFLDRNGELCGEDATAAAEIICLDCLQTAREIRLATRQYPFGAKWVREGDEIPGRMER